MIFPRYSKHVNQKKKKKKKRKERKRLIELEIIQKLNFGKVYLLFGVFFQDFVISLIRRDYVTCQWKRAY